MPCFSNICHHTNRMYAERQLVLLSNHRTVQNRGPNVEDRQYEKDQNNLLLIQKVKKNWYHVHDCIMGWSDRFVQPTNRGPQKGERSFKPPRRTAKSLPYVAL
jgi:hypothetical protein